MHEKLVMQASASERACVRACVSSFIYDYAHTGLQIGFICFEIEFIMQSTVSGIGINAYRFFLALSLSLSLKLYRYLSIILSAWHIDHFDVISMFGALRYAASVFYLFLNVTRNCNNFRIGKYLDFDKKEKK